MTEEKEVAIDQNGQEKSETNGDASSELESAIIRQVEYYFGDLNLPRDKFLREQVQLDDGWVPLDILTRFNRLAKLTEDTKVIADAINNSTSGLLEISDDNKKVRRNPELPVPEMNEERRKELMSRTVYAKGFAKDASLDDLLKYFKQFDVVENIIMRKYQDRQTKKRHFKGSVFATFKTREQAEKFMSTKELKYEDTELLLLWQENYVAQKQEEYATKKEKRDKKSKPEKDSEKEQFKLPTGTVLSFTEAADTLKREDIRDALAAIGAEVAYVDFKLGDSEGFVRLAKADTAKEIIEKLTDGKLKIGEKDVLFKQVDEEEEKKYLDKSVEEMTKRRKNQKHNSRQNKGRQHRGGKQNRKRKQEDQHDDAPPSKVKADDS